MGTLGSNTRSGPITWIAIVALAIVAAALVVFALRSDPVPNAGHPPATPMTPSPPSAPSADPTAAATRPPVKAETVSRRFLASDGQFGVRAETGDCIDSAAPSVELTNDGGVNWTPASIPPEAAVREVVGVQIIDADQIDLVVRSGAACSLGVLTSYTAGQFWDAYPERLATQSFIDSADLSAVTIEGLRVASPCSAPEQVVTTGSLPLVRCVEGLFAYSDEATTWHVVAAMNTSSVATSGQLAVATGHNDACAGSSVVAFPLDGSNPSGQPVSCVPARSSSPIVAIASSVEDELWLWADDSVQVSVNGGAEWVQPAQPG